MPKKLKLNLKGLKVQSFVTSLKDEEKTKIRGGDVLTNSCLQCTETCQGCNTYTDCPTCPEGTCVSCETFSPCHTCETCPELTCTCPQVCL